MAKKLFLASVLYTKTMKNFPEPEPGKEYPFYLDPLAGNFPVNQEGKKLVLINKEVLPAWATEGSMVLVTWSVIEAENRKGELCNFVQLKVAAVGTPDHLLSMDDATPVKQEVGVAITAKEPVPQS